MIRGGYGISYVHFSRAGGGDLLPINGPQVVNAVVNQTQPAAASFVPAERGYPAGLADPSRFDPLTANITYMPRDFHSSPVQSYYVVGPARAAAQHGRSTSRSSATAPTTCCSSPTTTRRRRTTPPARFRCRIAARIRAFADITYAFNGGKSRYKALQAKFEWRLGRDRSRC